MSYLCPALLGWTEENFESPPRKLCLALFQTQRKALPPYHTSRNLVVLFLELQYHIFGYMSTAWRKTCRKPFQKEQGFHQIRQCVSHPWTMCVGLRVLLETPPHRKRSVLQVQQCLSVLTGHTLT